MTALETSFDQETVGNFLRFLGEESMPDGCEMAILIFHYRYSKLASLLPESSQNRIFDLLRNESVIDAVDSGKIEKTLHTLK